MTQLIIQDLHDDLRTKLEARARNHGRSIEDEARDILAKAVVEHADNQPNLGSRIAACFAGDGLEASIPEMRGHAVEPIGFDA